MPPSVSVTHTRYETWVDLLRERVQAAPDQRALDYVEDDDATTTRWTCAELDRRARAIGGLLQEHGAGGERALLLYPAGLDFVGAFFGCLYAATVAVPTYPPRPRSLGRFSAIAEDAAPAVVLTTADLHATFAQGLREVPGFPQVRWIITDDLPAALADAWRPPSIGPDSLAFLQYTSGSTTTPRGVMVSHGNLLHNSEMIHRCFATTAEDSGVIWLPSYHDMGLIGGILQPLYAGMPVTLMSPVAFLQRPFRWLDLISRTGATISGGPNFAYDLCVRKTTPEQRATLDLSRWAVAFSGAEPVRPETLRRFADTFASCGFRPEAWAPCYGLAEATLFVTGGERGALPVLQSVVAPALEQNRVLAASPVQENVRTLVGCGHAWLDQQVAIVDPDALTRCPADRVGEIWVSGPSVAGGYWNRPEENAAVFGARLVGAGEGPWLRTGDLGYLASTQAGGSPQLFITGRLKELIIVDGRNHYPQDIEETVQLSHPALRPHGIAAFSVEVEAEERLVVVAELEREYLPGRGQAADPDAVARAVRRAVSEQHAANVYDLVLVKPGSVPVTTSGKIQRRACRASYLAGEISAIDPKTARGASMGRPPAAAN